MRNSSLRFVACALFSAGCVASGSDAEPHGQSFDGPSSDGAISAPRDAGMDALLDARSPGASDAADAPSPDATVTDAPTIADAAPDAKDTSASPDASPTCTATTVIVAGGASSAFGASAVGPGSFVVQALGGAALSPPGLVAFGSGFAALLRTSGNGLASVGYGAAWTATSAFAVAGALAAPTLSPVGGALHGVYLGIDNRYYHGVFDGSKWDSASDPVGHVADGGTQAFGPAAASSAAAGGALVLAYQGNDQHLYTQSWTPAAGWSDGAAVGTATLYANAAPALVALGGATNDLLVVYVASDTKLYAAVRAAATKVWSAPGLVDATAFTHDEVRAAATGTDRAVVVYRGTDQKPYATTYDASRGAPWSVPAPIAGVANPAVLSVPSVSSGVCGDDALAAFVDSAGNVSTATLRGTAWASRGAVAGIGGASVVTIATRP